VEAGYVAPRMAADVFRLVGSVLDNRYRIDSVVGEGGFGVVYRGFHLAFGQPIAIKCLKVDARFQGDARALFLRKFREEASFLARLSQHPAVVRVFDLNVTTSPTAVEVPYLVLEWLEGMELEVWLSHRAMRGLPLKIRFEVTPESDWLYGVNISNWPEGYDSKDARPVEVELRHD